jgi:hypothetical protein
MPSLIEMTWVEKTKVPFVWICSICSEVFSLRRVPASNPSVTELKRVNSEFSLHCTREHPGQPVAGLEIETPKEDASQSAARIVREATED